MSINRVILTGNLTRSPELRAAASTSVLKLGLAVNDRRKVDGELTDAANFVDVTVFGNRAESLAGLLNKGDRIGVDGKLRWSSWEKDGEKRSKLEVVADDVELLGGKPNGGNESGHADEPIPF